MDDLVRLIEALNSDQIDDPFVAVATVVNTRGSAYRRPGARMLIRRSRAVQGAVSAGCLERDIIEHCQPLIERPETSTMLLTYDGSSSDDLVFGLKLGCDGIVQILLETLGQSSSLMQVSRLLPSRLTGEMRAVAITVFSCDITNGFQRTKPKAGLAMIVSDEIDYKLVDLPESIYQLLLRDARSALISEGGKSSVVLVEADGYKVSALVEVVSPLQSLVIFGNGQSGAALRTLAELLRWKVTVLTNIQIDQCSVDELAAHVQSVSPSAAVIMTHNYEKDQKVLHALLTSNNFAGGEKHRTPAYVGMVGPKRRAEKLFSDLVLAGVEVTSEQLSRFYGPIGLDLGAEQPEEIALAIAAEIKAATAGSQGGFLRDKQGPIHEALEVRSYLSSGGTSRGLVGGAAITKELPDLVLLGPGVCISPQS